MVSNAMTDTPVIGPRTVSIPWRWDFLLQFDSITDFNS